MFNLIVGWIFMAAFYVVYMRGYSTPDPVRAARFTYRKQVSGRFGLLPPSREPIGQALWAITVLGFLAALAFFLIGERFIGASNGTMVVAFGITLWRDERWIRQQPEYQAMLDELQASRENTDDG